MMTAILTARNILAGERLYDVWNVNEDAQYQESSEAECSDQRAIGAAQDRLVRSALDREWQDRLAERLAARFRHARGGRLDRSWQDTRTLGRREAARDMTEQRNQESGARTEKMHEMDRDGACREEDASFPAKMPEQRPHRHQHRDDGGKPHQAKAGPDWQHKQGGCGEKDRGHSQPPVCIRIQIVRQSAPFEQQSGPGNRATA